ncbi:hypothetical protein Y032_0070g421 [Ancylostoma ceylanicum]|uniref:Uncharacterized protein n=2 Tax=Ancylostoma ceylanicum TaxID=53326 RepID=A0A016TYK9_9BILA|nr:hypothetical protein Y032_0070g421 [Ancylostoma ceylanicum]
MSLQIPFNMITFMPFHQMALFPSNRRSNHPPFHLMVHSLCSIVAPFLLARGRAYTSMKCRQGSYSLIPEPHSRLIKMDAAKLCEPASQQQTNRCHETNGVEIQQKARGRAFSTNGHVEPTS